MNLHLQYKLNEMRNVRHEKCNIAMLAYSFLFRYIHIHHQKKEKHFR